MSKKVAEKRKREGVVRVVDKQRGDNLDKCDRIRKALDRAKEGLQIYADPKMWMPWDNGHTPIEDNVANGEAAQALADIAKIEGKK